MRPSFLLSLILISILGFQFTIAPISNDEFPATKSNLLSFSFLPENIYYRAAQSDTHYVYTQIRADQYQPAETKRLPLNICLVIDRSGSMSGDKLKYVKDAATFLVNNLNTEDYISIVVYESNVNVLLASTKATNKAQINKLIAGIVTAGSTNLSGGLLEGYSQIKESLKDGYVNRVLLLSDGLANAGVVDPTSIKNMAMQANLNHGITTSSFGVGADFNEDLMLGISESGSGNYYFIENPDKIPDIFSKEMNGLLSVVAQNIKVKIQLPPNVKMIQLFGYENQSKDSTTIEINLRDISSEEIKSFLFSYTIATQNQNPLTFRSTFNYNDAINSNSDQQTNMNFTVFPSYIESAIEANINADVLAQYAIFYNNWVMQNAMKLVDQGQYDGAKTFFENNNLANYKYQGLLLNNKDFVSQDSIILNYKTKIDEVKVMNEYDKKVYQKSNKAVNYNIQKKKK
jgi:Ca-activated chloride channel family protein